MRTTQNITVLLQHFFSHFSQYFAMYVFISPKIETPKDVKRVLVWHLFHLCVSSLAPVLSSVAFAR
jgi:hypothetical protein